MVMMKIATCFEIRVIKESITHPSGKVVARDKPKFAIRATERNDRIVKG